MSIQRSLGTRSCVQNRGAELYRSRQQGARGAPAVALTVVAWVAAMRHAADFVATDVIGERHVIGREAEQRNTLARIVHRIGSTQAVQCLLLASLDETTAATRTVMQDARNA